MNNFLKVKSLIILLVPLLFLLLLISCNENPPEIPEVYFQINMVHDLSREKYYESLSLFAHITDEDGTDDIQEIYCIDDANELFWRLTEDSWIQYEDQGELWIGSNGLIVPGESVFPRGELRLLAIDSAGERSEIALYNNTPAIPFEKIHFPSIRLENSTVLLNFGGNDEGEIRFYDENGSLLFIQSVMTESDQQLAEALRQRRDQLSASSEFWIYYYDQLQGFGVASGPYDTTLFFF